MSPAELLRSASAADASRPFVTFYDDATGERVELSVATFDNWVAKTANLLQDGLVAAPGDRCALLLPTHWQTQVWLLACWSVGVLVAVDADPAGADLVVTGPDDLESARGCPGERVALSLRPLGGRFPSPPDGFLDYAAEVASYGDRFTPYAPVDPSAPALELEGRTLCGAEIVAEARAAATSFGVSNDKRLLTANSLASWPGMLAALLLPLAAHASVVLCRNVDQAALPSRVKSERVTDIATVTRDGGLSVYRN